MALPKSLQHSLSPQELSFLAENETILIEPSIQMETIGLISGNYGPLVPPNTARVPLWMAISLKKKRRCKIIPPDWLSVDNLQALLRGEKEKEDTLNPLPRRYIEISKLMLDFAPDNLTLPSTIRSLLKDLREVRQAKVRKGLQSEDTMSATYLQVTNLTPLELSEIKPFLVKAMGMIQNLEMRKEGEDEEDEEELDIQENEELESASSASESEGEGGVQGGSGDDGGGDGDDDEDEDEDQDTQDEPMYSD